MEQTPSSPGRSPELPSVSPSSNGETLGSFSHPEKSQEGARERLEERQDAASAEQSALPPAVLPIPAPALASDDDAATTQPAIDPPSVANDDDLIEKEWVDKAKKIIADTKDDPYRREQAVSRLQADYLAKRYGRQLGSRQ